MDSRSPFLVHQFGALMLAVGGSWQGPHQGYTASYFPSIEAENTAVPIGRMEKPGSRVRHQQPCKMETGRLG